MAINGLLDKNKVSVYFVDDEICVINGSSICSSSNNTEKIREKLENPAPGLVRHDLDEKISLFLDQNKVSYLNHIPFINNLVRLIIDQSKENNMLNKSQTDQLVFRLINNYGDTGFNAEQEALNVGIDLKLSRAAILMEYSDFEEKYIRPRYQTQTETDEFIQKSKRDLHTTLKNFFTQSLDLIITYLGDNRFIIYKTVSEKEEKRFIDLIKKAKKAIFNPIKFKPEDKIIIGYSNSYFGVKGFSRSFHEAELALDLGKKFLPQNEENFHFDELKELRILAEKDENRKKDFAQTIIKNLNAKLLKTLEVFFNQNLNIAETAANLKIHPNTVIYRLNQATKVLNLNPRSFNQATAIRMAMLTLKIYS